MLRPIAYVAQYYIRNASDVMLMPYNGYKHTKSLISSFVREAGKFTITQSR